ncbi:M56 family metallopeptidase [Sphingomonas sp. Y38-1Y]|uniref:M56 family metallopeptidase n=1 Tax=Sphingomonas sp. Y38-1Y TaxID=3078265 RepID=UPI0028EEDCB4|nr:M56 family metallopeptidase [Sphingomonas sp. Y38-1Y]
MIAWAIETFVATSLLMALVLVIRAPVRRAVGPQIAYALWALPLLRMLLPPMPAEWREAGVAPVALASEALAYYVDLPVAVDATPQAGLPWATMIVATWIVGALGFVAWHLIAYSRFCNRMKAGARRQASLVGGRVAMIESDGAAGPLAFGIWRKYVAFPADFAERYDELERDLALAHELGHHARGDLAANWAALAMLGFHWFNPLAWRAFRAFRADQEMACDALVLAGRHAALRHAYGRAIVKSAHGGAVSAACHLHTVNEIKGRLRMLTQHQKPRPQTARAGFAGIAALTLTGLALTASGTRAAENLKAKVEDKMGVSIDDIELPQLPLPPEPAAAPEAPAAIAAPEATEAPAAPRVIHISKDGKRTVIVRRGDPADAAEVARLTADAHRMADAARQAGEGARRAALAIRVPLVRSERCGGNGPTSYHQSSADGRTRVTIICTDRIERDVASANDAQRNAALIERQAERQARLAEQSAAWAERRAESNARLAEKRAELSARLAERNAERSQRLAEQHAERLAFASSTRGIVIARSSIRSARSAILADRDLTPEQRDQALKGMDEALAEMERDHGE